MPIDPDPKFKLTPIPSIPHVHAAALLGGAAVPPPLGLLAPLAGVWKGTGFNQIFRPQAPPKLDNFLELNLTLETLEFTEIPGEIPNRGMVQGDISLFGLTYLQQVADANVKNADGSPAGIHIEPGIWLNIPITTDPADPASVARLANIPHGTSLVAQGTAQVFPGAPKFERSDITPFPIGDPTRLIHFDSQDLSKPSTDRSPASDIVGITQTMVDDPNSVLAAALVGRTITSTTVITISTSVQKQPVPSSGGGTSNIAFLDGAAGPPPGRPNARAVQVDATFWISPFTDSTGASGTLLQYTQRVLLNFNNLSWPHVSVANLIKQPDKPKEVKESKETKEAKETKETKEAKEKEHKPEIKEHKPEIKEHKSEIKEHKPEIKEHKLELKEHDTIPGFHPVPSRGARAGHSESVPTGKPVIQPEERPPVGKDVPEGDKNS
jgi:hypothetical protein